MAIYNYGLDKIKRTVVARPSQHQTTALIGLPAKAPLKKRDNNLTDYTLAIIKMLVVNDFPEKYVAELLGISHKTVQKHVERFYRIALGGSGTRIQSVKWLFRNEKITLEEFLTI